MDIEKEYKESEIHIVCHPYELLVLGVIVFAAIVELVWLWGKV